MAAKGLQHGILQSGVCQTMRPEAVKGGTEGLCLEVKVRLQPHLHDPMHVHLGL